MQELSDCLRNPKHMKKYRRDDFRSDGYWSL